MPPPPKIEDGRDMVGSPHPCRIEDQLQMISSILNKLSEDATWKSVETSSTHVDLHYLHSRS